MISLVVNIEQTGESYCGVTLECKSWATRQEHEMVVFLRERLGVGIKEFCEQKGGRVERQISLEKDQA